ncbi:MAG: winged helix-turn-helix transcriptional regulator [Clostridia bacterium]|nr:winged helix-turn-helix transcriptional regulator [Clostridia bacterium]
MDKPKYKVIASDPLYARLLRLELAKLGLTESEEGAKDYRILAAEGLTELPSVRRLKGAVFIDCGLLSAGLPEQVKVLICERPFSLTEFREFIMDVCESDDEGDFEENKLILTDEDMTVSFGDHTVKLTPREYALMAYLHARPGQVISRAELLHELWKDEYARDTNVVDVYVRFLRTKLDEPLGLRLIRAVRGEGYVYAYENEGELLRAAKPDGKEEKEQTDEKGAL